MQGGRTIRVRGGSGLGDSLYMQSVVRYLVQQGHRVEVCSDWPDVFTPLNGRAIMSGFRRNQVDKVAHYTLRRYHKNTTQFQDVCIQAGIQEAVDLRLDWSILNPQLVETVRSQAKGKPIVAVQLPRDPMNRIDGFGKELLPDCKVIQQVIDRLRDELFLVQIGKGKPLFSFVNLGLDLANKTSVSDLIDVVSASQGCLGYVSFMVPLAESLSKPLLAVWSRKGLVAQNPLIRSITPHKILHYETSKAVMDDSPPEKLEESVGYFLEQVRGPRAV